MSDIEIKVEADSTLKALDHIATVTSPQSLAEFLRYFAQPYFRARIDARFASEGDAAVGGKWQELAFNTARFREFKGFSPFHPINKRTGDMQRFLTSSFAVDAFGYGARLRIPGSLSGEMRKKVMTAQMGTVRGAGSERGGPNRPAPPRPVLAVDGLDARAISDGLLQWVTQGGIT